MPERTQVGFNQKNQKRRKDTTFVITGSDCQSDNTGRPDAGSGCETLYRISLCDNDRSGTEKTKTGDDLRTDPGYIGRQVGNQIQVQAGKTSDTCRKTYQCMRAETGRFVLF